MKILGIDECGRGSLGGPMCVGGVVFKDNIPLDLIEKIKDSKKLSSKKREELFYEIPKYSNFDVQFVSNLEIDKYGIRVCLRNSIFKIIMKMKNVDKIIYDGNWNPYPENSHFETCIKGEDSYKEIAAASIMAKVMHDKYMIKISKKYPLYGFENHKGYGTKEHRQAIMEHGLCSIHRKSWKIKY